MRKLLKITELVKGVLEEYPETRNDDNLLWLETMREAAYKNNCVYALDLGLTYIMHNIRALNLPTFESVSRARRKLQAKYPELRGTERARKRRAEKEIIYKEYAKNGISV